MKSLPGERPAQRLFRALGNLVAEGVGTATVRYCKTGGYIVAYEEVDCPKRRRRYVARPPKVPIHAILVHINHQYRLAYR